MIDERDWVVVAPWWRWDDPKDSDKGRATAPIFQKYDSPTLVNDFMKSPQRSLVFNKADQVGKITSLGALQIGGKNARPSDSVFDPDGDKTRKIFLTTHKRFYLVVCELHCDAPGFPRAASDKICEVGLVVRRRTVTSSAAWATTGAQVLTYAAAVQAEVARIEAAAAAAPPAGAKGLGAAVKRAAQSAAVKARPAAQARLAAARRLLDTLRGDAGLAIEREGWFKSTDGHDKVGAWKTVEEAPADLAGEMTYPMHALFADPTVPDHPAKHGTIYFAMLPTGGGETNDGGRPRFDDQDLYEVYCYVKRHHKPHPRGTPCPCPKGIFWSAPSEPFQLASHFDLDGTSNNPVIVQLPDLGDLAARAKPSLGLGFKKPPGSLMVAGNSDGTVGKSGLSAAFEICFFAIPLITIVATFVFELFLPVVVLLFGLFFLLRLKLCIPPSIDVSLQADLQAKVAADLQVGATVSADLGATLNAEVDSDLIKLFPDPTDTGTPPTIKSENVSALEAEYTMGALAQMDLELSSASAKVGGDAAAKGPSITGDLEWMPEVKYG